MANKCREREKTHRKEDEHKGRMANKRREREKTHRKDGTDKNGEGVEG
jgi:hypothetical protein